MDILIGVRWYLTVVFDLHFSDDLVMLKIFLCTYWPSVCLLWGKKMSLQVFCLFLNWILVFFSWMSCLFWILIPHQISLLSCWALSHRKKSQCPFSYSAMFACGFCFAIFPFIKVLFIHNIITNLKCTVWWVSVIVYNLVTSTKINIENSSLILKKLPWAHFLLNPSP